MWWARRFVPLAALVVLPSAGAAQIVEAAPPAMSEEEEAFFEAVRVLKEPLRFEPGTATLTGEAVFWLHEQAWVLSLNPNMSVTIFVGDGANRALAAERAATLAEALADDGVDLDRITLAAPLLDDVDVGPDEAVAVGLGGSLDGGVRLVRFDVEAWPGAEVFVLPDRLVRLDPRVLCDPPEDARVGLANTEGRAEARHSRRTVVVLGRSEGRMATRVHLVGVPPLDAPVDLASQVHDPRCDADD